ncbi:hypothetical protein FIBSPDRAFT_1047281 [Athelia psychrophila]|uniref:MYND-type domain-containing protein n=1 Tax=Athelia psychrophila TaxID=1759441 RepID=A0A166FHX9_9AGAM|nr:hypothetical protein FIBSPDRAFT_1047281 [Fibularhizoctonia sp. CBS 109695]
MVSPLQKAARTTQITEMTPSGQRRWVEHLQALINTMESGTPEEMAAIGYDWSTNIPHVLESLQWRTSQALRWSAPTRVYEAVPYLEKVIESHRAFHPTEVDVTPTLWLAVALHKTPGQEERALALHARAIGATQPGQNGFRTMLWAKANMSRMLRRMGKVAEAQKNENEIVNWLKDHPYVMSMAEFSSLVTDPERQKTTPPERDYIMTHPTVVSMSIGRSSTGKDAEIIQSNDMTMMNKYNMPAPGTPVDEDTTDDPRFRGCAMCGMLFNDQPDRLKACGGCKKTFYCSKEHQTAHWKTSHKKQCSRKHMK